MTTEEKIEVHDRQLEALISIAAKHTGQIEALACVAEKQGERLDALIVVAEQQGRDIRGLNEAVASLERQWLAYINTLPRQ